MKLVVLRHPRVLEPEVCYGELDVPIASWDETEGLLAAQRGYFEGLRGDSARLLTSPRTRCRIVADWVASILLQTPLVVGDLAEMSLGSFEGHKYSLLEGRADFQSFMEQWETAVAPEGESVAMLEARVRRALEQRRQENPDGSELWVAHAGVVRSLRVILEGKSWSEAMREKVPHLVPVEFTL